MDNRVICAGPMMKVDLVDLKSQYQSIKQEIDRAIARVLDRTTFILGEEVELFEREFALYCEVEHAIGVDSGVSALELGMRALGIGEGDEVITPANSFIASSSSISLAGARPVFVDVDPETYNIDVSSIRGKITERTKAIMAVHLYGQPADMDAIMDIADQHDLFVIEDACQAHGARWNGRRVGSLGRMAAFSFYPSKNLGAYGDGGAVVTNDPRIADTIRTMRNYGQTNKHHHVSIAMNRRLDAIQAAVLRIKLRYLDEWNDQRQKHAALYHSVLEEAEVMRPKVCDAGNHVYHLYVVRVDHRDDLGAFLSARGVSTGIHYPTPIHLQPAYAGLGYKRGDFPIAEQAANQILSLPMFPQLLPQEVEYVATCVKEFQDSESATGS